MKIHFKANLNKGANHYLLFPVPLKLNPKIIEIFGNNKALVTVTNKKKTLDFIGKAAKFGSKNNGDRRCFFIPKALCSKMSALCGEDKVNLTIQNW